MTLQTISPSELLVKPFDLIKYQTLVLTSGSYTAGNSTRWLSAGFFWARCGINPARLCQ
jgi:hypothetical protein